MQMILFALFIYPLLRQNSWRRENNVSDTALLNRVKKAMLPTALSIATGVITLIFQLIFDSVEIIVLYNISLFENIIIIINCFDHWKTILWPCCSKSD